MMSGILGTMNSSSVKKVKPFMLVLLLACLFSGCAGKLAGPASPVFFPPPPDDPHIQFLTGISSSTDLAEKQSEMSRLLTGGSQTVIRIGKPYGVATHKGKVYICDIGAAQVVVVDFANKTMKNLNEEPGAAELKKPIGITVDEDGNVYVADNGRKDIAVYGPDGKYLRSMGRDLQHTSIIGVAAHKQYLMALDNRQGKIFVMDRKSGELLTTIGENVDRTKNMALPNGITVDSNGNIRVVNMGNGKVKEYDIDGHLLSEFGQLGDRPGEFTRPRGVAVDESGQIYVVDAGHQVVQVFNNERRILGYFGKPGLPAGSLNLPAGIAVTKDNLDLFQKMAAPGFKLEEVIFVVNQYASPINFSLAVYGLGEMEGKKGASKEQPAKKDGKTADKAAKGKP
ncbi:MAG: hypothetical protein A2075_18460 [Geobacteraceae bacterium GWC2_58_44]|nr:MAG: hypothetical protein A2075_18460 [Geobacteraceae bacterium GWC2_58_44]HBG06624.1 hypothetical protein [Geobacter sp.]